MIFRLNCDRINCLPFFKLAMMILITPRDIVSIRAGDKHIEIDGRAMANFWWVAACSVAVLLNGRVKITFDDMTGLISSVE